MTSYWTLNLSLFEENRLTEIALPHGTGELWYIHEFLSPDQAKDSFQLLLTNTPWQQEIIKVYGKSYPSPRLTAWYGDVGVSYTYSGISHSSLPWTPCLLDLRARVEKACCCSFNSVLLNLYRDGQDSVGWHSDDERELGRDPAIASLSLGQTRRFLIKPKKPASTSPLAITLEDGSLLLMKGAFQHAWRHAVPKQKNVFSPRINLTFRLIREQ